MQPKPEDKNTISFGIDMNTESGEILIRVSDRTATLRLILNAEQALKMAEALVQAATDSMRIERETMELIARAFSAGGVTLPEAK